MAPRAKQHLQRCSLSQVVGLLSLAILFSACGATSTTPSTSVPSPSGNLTLYTSVTQDTVDALVIGYKAQHPGVEIEVFRALTGQVNARIAAEERSGAIKADLIWQSEPLSLQPLADRHRLLTWSPANANAIPARYRESTFFGTRLLNLVIVYQRGLTPAPRSWSDLTGAAFSAGVAIPNPAAAGTAFGALGYFTQAPGYGVDYYRKLKGNGAVQVQTINDVVTGVAEGRFKAGMTLDTTARQAIAKGSPIEISWPRPGAISIYSPIAVTSNSTNAATARSFVEFVLGPDGQRLISTAGWQPARDGVPGPPRPAGAREVAPDWGKLFGRQQRLLDEYRAIFGG